MNRWFVTGIDTGVGKTVVSTILTHYAKADYWKPVQAGDLDASDSGFVRAHGYSGGRIHPERYAFATASSPHQAAACDGKCVVLDDFELPETNQSLVVEGAGGLLVPINQQEFMIDLVLKLDLPVVLVIRDYLGCINHTLLSVEVLRQRKIKIACAVFNGDFNPWTESLLSARFGNEAPILKIPYLTSFCRENIQEIGSTLQTALF